MDSGPHDNIEEVKADRLSNLSDDLIHKILSSVCINDAVKTMVLSSRYRFIWTTLPYLNFDTYDIPRLQNFVDYFLKRRNDKIDVSSLELRIGIKQFTNPSVKKLMRYAFSHNIQRVEVTCMSQGRWEERAELIEFPLSLFSSKSLEHLSLNNYIPQGFKLKATSILDLPALTTLYLEGITFVSDDTDCCVVGVFSKCSYLTNLTLKECKTDYRSSLSICHPGISNLTLYDIRGQSVNVVAPQLENLTITYDDFSGTLEHVISAPNLASLAYRGRYPLHLSTNGFHSLKEADIRVLNDHLDVDDDAPQIVGLLQQLHNVKFLTLNLEIIELLSESVELISHQPSPFVNLKSLTIYPENLDDLEENLDDLEENLDDLEENLDDSKSRSRPKGKVNLSTEVRNYLLDSSPGASVTMFSREEIIEERNFASAQQEMARLRVLLEQEKANNIKTNDRAKMQLGSKALIWSSCWEDLNTQFKKRKATVWPIINTFRFIEDLLRRELPATKRAMLETRFSSLCAEVDAVMGKITNMHCENQSRTNAYFQQLATISTTTMEPFSN